MYVSVEYIGICVIVSKRVLSCAIVCYRVLSCACNRVDISRSSERYVGSVVGRYWVLYLYLCICSGFCFFRSAFSRPTKLEIWTRDTGLWRLGTGYWRLDHGDWTLEMFFGYLVLQFIGCFDLDL